MGKPVVASTPRGMVAAWSRPMWNAARQVSPAVVASAASSSYSASAWSSSADRNPSRGSASGWASRQPRSTTAHELAEACPVRGGAAHRSAPPAVRCQLPYGPGCSLMSWNQPPGYWKHGTGKVAGMEHGVRRAGVLARQFQETRARQRPAVPGRRRGLRAGRLRAGGRGPRPPRRIARRRPAPPPSWSGPHGRGLAGRRLRGWRRP
jgi:hypothetical protein